MFIFGNEAIFRNTLPTVVENMNVESTEDTETNVSSNEIESAKTEVQPIPTTPVVIKEKLCKKKSSLPTVLYKKSVASSGDDRKNFLAARAARYSCPICVESKCHPDLPLWLIASLSNELKETRQQGQRLRAQTLPVNPKESQVQEKQRRRNRASTVDQFSSNTELGRFPRGRTYTMCNVVVNLIATRRKRKVDRGLRLSQARHLVQILTTMLVFYLFWLPFLVSYFPVTTEAFQIWKYSG